MAGNHATRRHARVLRDRHGWLFVAPPLSLFFSPQSYRRGGGEGRGGRILNHWMIVSGLIGRIASLPESVVLGVSFQKWVAV